jgi:hypothetical protein
MSEDKPITLVYSVSRKTRKTKRRKDPNPGPGFKPPAPTENSPLNNSQRTFVKLVAEGLTPSAAAYQCGYKHPAVVASQMIRKPHIAKALREAREEYAKASMMTKKKVMDGFLDAIAQAKTLADPSAQIQGWNSIAKMCGYFEPTRHKIEVDVRGKVIVEKLQTLSDDDLLKLADGDADVLEAEYVQEEDVLKLPSPDTGTHDE